MLTGWYREEGAYQDSWFLSDWGLKYQVLPASLCAGHR